MSTEWTRPYSRQNPHVRYRTSRKHLGHCQFCRSHQPTTTLVGKRRRKALRAVVPAPTVAVRRNVWQIVRDWFRSLKKEAKAA